MRTWQKRPANRWASAAVVIGSVGAVLASPLSLGSAAAADPPPVVTSVTINSVDNAPAAGPATIHATYAPAAGVSGTAPSIQWTVLGGHNTASPGFAGTPCMANLDGTVSCSITNASGTAGTDNIRVFADANGNNAWDAGEKMADTSVVFSGAPSTITLNSPGATSSTDTCAQWTGHVTDSNGAPAAGQTVRLTVSESTATSPAANSIKLFNAACTAQVDAGGTTTGTGPYTTTYTHDFTVATDSSGNIAFGLASAAAGTATVTLSDPSNAAVHSAPSTVTFSAGGANNVAHLTVTSPATTTQYTGTTASYTVKATDASNNPVQGVTVNKETTSGPDTLGITACGNTDNAGTTTCTITNGGTAGTDQLTFWVNTTTGGAGTNGPDNGEPQATATAVFNPQPTVDPGHSTVTCVEQLAGGNQNTAQANCTLPVSQKSVTFTAKVADNTGTAISGANVTFTATSAKLGGATVTGSNLPSGSATTDANGLATFTVNNPSAAAGDNVTVSAKVGATGVGSASAAWAASHATALNVTPPLQSVTKGGTVTVKAQVTDQFGTAVSGTPNITYTVSGRNNGKTGTAAADGTISYVDTGVNTASNTDTITVLDNTDALNGSAEVDYITGAPTATAVTVDTSGLGVSNATCGATGHVSATGVALQGTTEVCALVKNAAGEVLAGKTVTFTVSNGQVAAHGGLTTTSGTTYQATTNAAGVAFADVSSTKSGAQTVTATADSASGTGTVTYLGATPAQAYKIAVDPATATVTPGTSQKFTATVTDKFGNVVPGVTVVYTQSGTGTIGGGSGGTTITGTDGTASITVNTTAGDTGTGSVTFSIGSAATIPANQCATTGGVCSAVATYTVANTGAAALSLTPETGAKIHTHETIHAVATKADGTPAAGVVIRFIVRGANSLTGSMTTGAAGRAGWSYLAAHHGTDTVSAWVDLNNDGAYQSNEPPARTTAHIKGIERPTISVVSHKKNETHGTVTIHVVSRPLAKGALVHYFEKRHGSWVKIGSNHTGHLGKAGKTFTRKSGKHLTFRAKVMTTPTNTTGTSSPRSVTVR